MLYTCNVIFAIYIFYFLGEELTINYFSKLNDDEYKKLTRKRSHKSCLYVIIFLSSFFLN